MRTSDHTADDRADAFVRDLVALGFAQAGASRRGGVMWSLAFNQHLQFHVHDYGEHVVVTWSFDLGGFVQGRGWVLGATDEGYHELYPRADARVAREVQAVEKEISRTLGTLRVDLGDPSL